MATTPPRFHRLTVRDVVRQTPHAVSIAFDVPPGLRDDYAFEPGQYLTLRTTIDGEDLRRSYSICAGPDDGELRVAVKQVERGAFSSWVNTSLKAGDSLEVMTPTGRFGAGAACPEGGTYVAFAAGSGITPVLSIVRGVLAREPRSRFFLFYGNRTTADILFNDELTDLKDRFLNRLSVLHVLSREAQDIPILNGHLDGEKVRSLLTSMVPVATVDHAFVCGPAGLIDDVTAALAALGVEAAKIHVERFVSTEGGVPKKVVVSAPPDAPAAHTAVLILDGKRREVPVAEGEAIVDAAIRGGVDLPFACKGGMCATCRAKIVEGAATMDVNYSLEPWELQAGYVLTCQAHPTTPRIVVDYDQV
jgi:ring-1,2-phenylacetyl-CoA epoxidase subunit PaaE